MRIAEEFLVPSRDAASIKTSRVFGFAGASGSGKTTLIEKVIAQLRSQGQRVSSIKHAHHGFDIDRPGKDSHRLREAGCEEVMLVGDARWVLMKEFREEVEPDLLQLVQKMEPVDIILVEGFKSSPIPKIEVFRPNVGKTPLWPDNPSVVAVATDTAIECPLPLIDVDDIRAVSAFVARNATTLARMKIDAS